MDIEIEYVRPTGILYKNYAFKLNVQLSKLMDTASSFQMKILSA